MIPNVHQKYLHVWVSIQWTCLNVQLMLFPLEMLYRKFITVKFSLNMQKKSGGLEKCELMEFRIIDIDFKLALKCNHILEIFQEL